MLGNPLSQPSIENPNVFRAKVPQHPCRSRNRKHSLTIITDNLVSAADVQPSHVLGKHFRGGQRVGKQRFSVCDFIDVEMGSVRRESSGQVFFLRVSLLLLSIFWLVPRGIYYSNALLL